MLRQDGAVEVFSRHRNPILLSAAETELDWDPALLASAFYVWDAAGEIDPETVQEGGVMVGSERFTMLAAPLAPVP